MKKIILVLTLLTSLEAYSEEKSGGCVINTNNLHFNNTTGVGRVESILKNKGYVIVSQENDTSDFKLEIQYFGSGVHKSLHMMIWSGYPDNPKNIFHKSVDYKTPFGIEGGIFERVHVVKLAKQVLPCH